jgi:hypothetical protein
MGAGLGIGGVPTAGGISGIGGVPGATCVALATPPNGQILYSMGGTFGPFPQGTTATLTCYPGFSVNSGLPTASCMNGIWNPSSLGQCLSSALNPNGLGPGISGIGAIGSSCPAITLVPNGQLQYSSGPGLGSYPEGVGFNF